jgi:cephalosporin hydroxylase
VKASRAAKGGAAVVTRSLDTASRFRSTKAARTYTKQWPEQFDQPQFDQPQFDQPSAELQAPSNLEAFFEARTEGRGIVKWRHYFEIYDRHLSKFVGKPSTLLEIGIYGGGSLDMWREYLGPECDRYGVDIDPQSKRFEDVSVFIGDQADRAFWARFRAETPSFDIIIDDGGHDPVQQLVTLEELLPCLRPGGVYICEDIHGERNPFLGYVSGLSRGLFGYSVTFDERNPERALSSPATPFQSAIHSVHLYPFLAVVERRPTRQVEFVASKHGTEWPQ